jgi:hypothetical protein
VARSISSRGLRDLHAGGLVFIPANTWISPKNIGADAIALTFVFSAPHAKVGATPFRRDWRIEFRVVLVESSRVKSTCAASHG